MRLALAAVLLAAGCAPVPEPDVPEGMWLLPGTSWRLVELGGAPFAAETVATLTEDGRISGKAPCNRFTATWRGRWPDLTFDAVAATRMACPDLAAETAFFAALAAANHAELGEAGLTLTGPGGESLRFERE